MATLRARGNRWQVQIRRKGQPVVSRSFLVKRDAETWARQTEAALERGELPAKAGPAAQRVILSDLVVRYRETVSVHKKGHEVERIVLNAFLRHPICQKWADAITPADFAAYRDERLQKVCRNTLRREFSTLHHMLETARNEWGLLSISNSLQKLRIGRPSPHRERCLRPGEEQALLLSADGCRNKIIATIISFALETAMRRGEILGLLWTDIDLQNRSALIRNAKNGSPRHVPLTLSAMSLLMSISADGDPVFPVGANAFRLAWERLVRRAGIKDLHFHDLRHEAISRFFELGLSAPEVALISGHRDMRMLFRYTHPTRQRILQRLDANPGSTGI